jgi:hypothetical protein
MSTPINVIIDNKTVLDDLVSVEMSQQEGTYCNSVSLSLKSKTFWSLCDPTTNFGELRIKVVIGSDTYQFLIEERDTTSVGPGVDFTVWGRSKQALLSKPYSKTVNDTDDTSYPWQSGSTSASAIVSYVVSNFCEYGVTVDWDVSNFIVYKGSFSASNQAPIDIISSLAGVIGAELVANIDGSLTVSAYSVAEGSSVQSYNDLDDIVSLDESSDYPSGYNAVTVYGYDEGGGGGGGAGGVSAYISAERIDEDDSEDADNSIYSGRDHTVRVYFYHSQGVSVRYSFDAGVCQQTNSGTETITEDVTLIFGNGNTSKTNTAGETAVTGDEDTPIEIRSVSYRVNYRDYAIRGSEVSDYSVMFYFTDKSATTIYSFTVVAAPDTDPDPEGEDYDDAAESCQAVTLEQVNTAVPGGYLYVKVYGQGLRSMETSSGATPSLKEQTQVETITESITISDGTGSTSKPIGGGLVTVSSPPPFSTAGMRYTRNTKEIEIRGFADEPSIPITVSYSTYVTTYMFKLSTSYKESTVVFWGTIKSIGNSRCTSKATITLSIPANADGGGSSSALKQDITINIKDYVTSVNVSSATVYIDGVYAGGTDASGLLDVPNISVGDHTIRITASGYQDSDLDDLANDTFTVSS